MTNETTNLFANLRTAIEVAGLGGAFAVVEVDDLEAVIALAETGAALASCEQIADDNDWRIVDAPKKYVAFEAFAYTYGKWQEVTAVYYGEDVTTPSEALARLALAALEAEAVNE